MTLQHTGGTEPLSFEALVLPGLRLLRDPLERRQRLSGARQAAGGAAPARGGA
ncbi:MAG TPA: hypothetical protein VF530_12065 [Planctomycetota bacterium]